VKEPETLSCSRGFKPAAATSAEAPSVSGNSCSRRTGLAAGAAGVAVAFAIAGAMGVDDAAMG
jgi:hypothetical protein